MYTIKTIDEVLKDKSRYESYKLCYVSEISETIYDYDLDSKKLIESPGFSWKKEEELFGWNSPRLNMCDQPNPEFIQGQQELFAYFTSIPLKDQWGDDWNDTPYEHNAELPYDDHWKNKISIEHEILQIPFAYKEEITFKLPADWSWGGNSAFSVEDINSGAIAWIFAYLGSDSKYNGISIYAGENPYEVIKKILKINLLETSKIKEG